MKEQKPASKPPKTVVNDPKPNQTQTVKPTDVKVAGGSSQQPAKSNQQNQNTGNPPRKDGSKPKTAGAKGEKKKSPEEEFSEYVPPGYEFEMKRKRDRDSRKPGVGDYQSKLLLKVKGFYDMNKTLPRNLFGDQSQKKIDEVVPGQRSKNSLRMLVENFRPEAGEEGTFQSHLEHSSSKSRSQKSPGRSPKRWSPRKPKRGIGYFENQFPKVRLEPSKPPTREFRRSNSGTDSKGFFHSARSTVTAGMQDTFWPTQEHRKSDLFGRKEGGYTYSKKYNHYDFSKSLPRSGTKKAKSSKNQAAYNPCYKVIEKKIDKLCIPFNKLVGRSQVDISTRASEHSLPTKMRLLSQLEKKQQLTARLEGLEQASKFRKTSLTANENSSPRKFFNLPSTRKPQETEYSGGVVHLPKNTTSSLRISLNSPFPGWLRKGSNTHRLGLTQPGEKACEMNHFSTGPMRAHQDLGKKYPGANKTLERFRLKPGDDEEEDEFEDLASVDYEI